MTASALTRPGERARLPVKIGEIDWRLTLIISILAGIGAVMLYSVGGGSWSPWAGAHLTRFGFTLAIMLVLALVDIRVWFMIAYPAWIMALLLLVGVELFGYTAMGATRWLDIGPLRLQPSEIMKVAVVLALARWYHGASAQDARLSWKLIFPVGLIMMPVLLVAKQPDLGTAVLIVLTGGSIMFVAGLSWKIIAAAVAGAAVAIPPFIAFVLHDYQRERIMTFMNPEADPSGAGYHILQSKIAMGSGGVFGRGLGLGSQSQLEFLPEKQTDFIFASVAEEMGLLVGLVVLGLYLAAIVISLRIASQSHSHFGRLAAAGVTATFAYYVLINGAMIMGMAPVVGVPMPLLSYGGTVMLTVMIGFGLIQSIRVHRYTELPRGRGLI